MAALIRAQFELVQEAADEIDRLRKAEDQLAQDRAASHSD
jgi:hypothetical protein